MCRKRNVFDGKHCCPSLTNSQKICSLLLHIIMLLMIIYCLIPIVWLFFSASKTQSGLNNSFGLWFADSGHGGVALGQNLNGTLKVENSIYIQWLVNTIIYAIAAGLGSTIISTLAGYAIATMNFRGRRIILAATLAFMSVPTTVLSIPLFLMYSKLGLVNTPFAVIVPQLVNPFGLYLMIIYTKMSIPNSLLEAAKVDGSGAWRTFYSIALPLLMPGFVTVLLFALVAAWNNYMLPLIMLNGDRLLPLTVGLKRWISMANESSARTLDAGMGTYNNFIMMGSLIAIIPIIIAFCCLQRYWQSGLAAGAIKQ